MGTKTNFICDAPTQEHASGNQIFMVNNILNF